MLQAIQMPQRKSENHTKSHSTGFNLRKDLACRTVPPQYRVPDCHSPRWQCFGCFLGCLFGVFLGQRSLRCLSLQQQDLDGRLSLSLSPIFWYRHGTLAPRARRLRIQLRIPGEVLCLKGDPEMTGHRPSVRDGGMEGWRRQFLGGFAPQSGSLCFAGFSVAC